MNEDIRNDPDDPGGREVAAGGLDGNDPDLYPLANDIRSQFILAYRYHYRSHYSHYSH